MMQFYQAFIKRRHAIFEMVNLGRTRRDWVSGWRRVHGAHRKGLSPLHSVHGLIMGF